MRCLLIFLRCCSVAVFRTLPCPPQREFDSAFRHTLWSQSLLVRNLVLEQNSATKCTVMKSEFYDDSVKTKQLTRLIQILISWDLNLRTQCFVLPSQPAAFSVTEQVKHVKNWEWKWFPQMCIMILICGFSKTEGPLTSFEFRYILARQTSEEEACKPCMKTFVMCYHPITLLTDGKTVYK